MHDALTFVKGCVAKEHKLKPELNHFRIERGRIVGLNDTFCLSAPIATDIEASPKGGDFVRAIERCKGKTITLFTDAGKLVVKSGRLTVRIDCTEVPFPTLQPEGHSFWVAPNFVEECKRLLPFLTKDNTRAWARGILVQGPTMSVTDNITLIQSYLGDNFSPPMGAVIPEPTLRELIRIGEPPKYASVSTRTITFIYEGDRWLCSVLLPNDWPNVDKFFAVQPEMQELTAEFWEGIETVHPFTNDNDALIFDPGVIRTSIEEKEGALIEGEFPTSKGAISAKFLMRLKPLATHVAFNDWPRPMQFYGPNIRGVIAGMMRQDTEQ